MSWLGIALFTGVNNFVEVLNNMECELKITSWFKKKLCKNYMVIRHSIKRVISEKQCYAAMKYNSKLRSISMRYFYNFKPYKIFSCIFNKSDILELKKFGSNKDIVVTRPDKGRGVVIVDRCVYIDKMLGIVSYRQKFDEVKESIHSYST